MRLFELAYACRLYQGAGFDDAYCTMRKALGQNPDLASPEQRDALMRFLNDWRCRIPEKNFPRLKESVQSWASVWIRKLPTVERDIRSLTPAERAQIGDSYEELLKLGAGLHFQDTATAKTLHALRPHTLPIWESEIKAKLSPEHSPAKRASGQIYSEFLCKVAREISGLEQDVGRLNHSLRDVPQLVQRQCSSVVKLVDEYYWSTITQGHEIPTRDELQKWLAWSE